MYYTHRSDQFHNIAHKIMIISGIIMFAVGIIGNFLNICIFTKWSCSRKSSKKCSRINNIPLYLLVSSFANLIVIIYPFSIRILIDGYQYEITQDKKYLLCKFRYYILHTSDLISLTSYCLAIFDRYLISSRNIHLRRFSQKKNQTILIITLMIILIGFHNIPIIIFFNVSSTGQCMIFSIKYFHYYLYSYQILLHGIIPIIFLSIFGILTYKQLKILGRHSRLNSERQLSRMVLLISLSIILSSIPNCIERIYDLIFVNKNEEYSSKFYLYHVIASIFYYINPVTSFNVFFISTPNFRLQLRNLCRSNQPIDYRIHSSLRVYAPSA